ncbi:MAG: acetyl-CoA carboxylase carboxyltransferase subunit beta [Fimbriimonadaceae bacterium]
MKADPRSPAMFVQCQGCRKTLFATEFESNLKVCGTCGHHHRLTWKERVEATFDPDTFVESAATLVSKDPLGFPDYAPKYGQAQTKTGALDSVTNGTARLEGMQVSVAVSDFHFMGGSMGSVAGEKITLALEEAVSAHIPAIVFCASGGARMQEGLLSLMQMAKTTAAVERCRSAGVPFISVFTDPTMAGVLASYASVADVILSEPRALVGFAGQRVAKQAGVHKAPKDFQTAEFAHRVGMIDRIVHRKEMRANLASLCRTLGGRILAEAGRG